MFKCILPLFEGSWWSVLKRFFFPSYFPRNSPIGLLISLWLGYSQVDLFLLLVYNILYSHWQPGIAYKDSFGWPQLILICWHLLILTLNNQVQWFIALSEMQASLPLTWIHVALYFPSFGKCPVFPEIFSWCCSLPLSFVKSFNIKFKLIDESSPGMGYIRDLKRRFVTASEESSPTRVGYIREEEFSWLEGLNWNMSSKVMLVLHLSHIFKKNSLSLLLQMWDPTWGN